MPELPDVTVYIEALRRFIVGEPLQRVRLHSPFLVRTFDPPLTAAAGRTVTSVTRIGKRIVWTLATERGAADPRAGGDAAGTGAEPSEPEVDGSRRAAGGAAEPSPGPIYMVFHLMIAGRFRWRPPGARIPGRIGLAAFDFAPGTVLMTEAGAKKRASLHVVRGEAALAEHDPGGLEVLDIGVDAFRERLALANHTLKRALTAPRLFSGIGNAYSDEILHRAQLAPLQWTSRLTRQETERLYRSAVEVLTEWTERLRRELGDGFPEKVTAFRDGMAVHGRYGKPCPRCQDPVQRIVYTDRETNYCATCQTGGRIYADRALSKLLKGDWPRSVEEWEQIGAGRSH